MTTKTFRLGTCVVEVSQDLTVTKFADGKTIFSHHQAQNGQEELAAAMGYKSAYEMNVHHDLTHTLVSTMIGLPHSSTLRGIADQNIWPHHRREEAAVLGVQQFAIAAGVDLLKVAEFYNRKD